VLLNVFLEILQHRIRDKIVVAVVVVVVIIIIIFFFNPR